MANDPINNVPNQQPYIGLGPFKLQIIQSFPFIEADFDAITNQQLLQKVVDYLNKVIQNNNTVTENITALYQTYTALQNYVNDYFQNLNVQDEINNKLDALAQDGTLTNLIEKYLTPYINEQNQQITSINNKVNTIANGSPAGVYNTLSDLVQSNPSHTNIYLVLEDGKWYYYNKRNTTWTAGGQYQSTGIEDGSITLPKLNNSVLGNQYTFNGTTRTVGTGVAFNLKNPTIAFPDITSVHVEFNMQNESETKATGILYLNLSRAGIFGRDVSFREYFTKYSDPDTIYPVNVTNNTVNITNNYIVNQVRVYYYNIAGSYNFKISDVKIYINNILQDIEFDATINTNALVTDTSIPIDFLATKSYLNQVASNLNNRMADIENKLPPEEDLNLAKSYDSSSKSNLYSIVCWGDSLTAARYPTDLRTFIDNPNVTVVNGGRSGETSGSIAWRAGGNIITTAEAITIPASNTEAVQFSFNTSAGFPSNMARVNLPATISNIKGTITYTYSNKAWFLNFTRLENGSAINVPANTIVYYTDYVDYNNSIPIIWLGRNDIAFAYPHIVDGTISNYQGIINNLTPTIKRFVVMGTTNSISEGIGTNGYNLITQMNNQLNTLYPNNYLNIREYLIKQAIYDLGITPTEQDLTNMENDCMPPSIMNADGLHLLPETYTLVAKQVYNFMLSKSWIIK